ncbi:MAG: hypothetical protein GOVbin631_63 [Prokaryotic dsDNA virus sp.]|nr:MAG: hypothetical protein GOVbin631_63 [Prokaryotic dsDNA virus sp.]
MSKILDWIKSKLGMWRDMEFAPRDGTPVLIKGRRTDSSYASGTGDDSISVAYFNGEQRVYHGEWLIVDKWTSCWCCDDYISFVAEKWKDLPR